MMKLFHLLWELLFPPKCVLCRNLLEKEETDLCRTCRVETELYPKGKRKPQFLDSFAAVWYYEGNVRGALLRFKFKGRRNLAPVFGRMVAMKLLREYPEGFDVLTWIPVSPMRKLRRGYDQCQLLAKAVGKELDMVPVSALKKIRNNPQQSGIQGDARRRANVLGVYRVTDPELIRDKRVLLLDDILTTGATAGEAARVLLTAGAKEVHCAAVAASRK